MREKSLIEIHAERLEDAIHREEEIRIDLFFKHHNQEKPKTEVLKVMTTPAIRSATEFVKTELGVNNYDIFLRGLASYIAHELPKSSLGSVDAEAS